MWNGVTLSPRTECDVLHLKIVFVANNTPNHYQSQQQGRKKWTKVITFYWVNDCLSLVCNTDFVDKYKVLLSQEYFVFD